MLATFYKKMSDKIFIENISTQATIGIHRFEKVAPQRLMISVELGTNIRQAAQTDDLRFALDYDAISCFIDEFVQASHYELLEALAENLVQQLFQTFAIENIQLRIEKPGAIRYTQHVGLVIYRERPNETGEYGEIV